MTYVFAKSNLIDLQFYIHAVLLVSKFIRGVCFIKLVIIAASRSPPGPWARPQGRTAPEQPAPGAAQNASISKLRRATQTTRPARAAGRPVRTSCRSSGVPFTLKSSDAITKRQVMLKIRKWMSGKARRQRMRRTRARGEAIKSMDKKTRQADPSPLP